MNIRNLLTLPLVMAFTLNANSHELNDWADEITQTLTDCRLELDVTSSIDEESPSQVDTLVVNFQSPKIFKVWTDLPMGFGSYGMLDVTVASENYSGGTLTSPLTLLLDSFHGVNGNKRPYTLFGRITLAPMTISWKGAKHKQTAWVSELPYQGVDMPFQYDTENKKLSFSKLSTGLYSSLGGSASSTELRFTVAGRSLSKSCAIKN